MTLASPEDQLRLMREIALVGSHTADLYTLGERVAELTMSAVGADACFVHRLDRDLRQVVLVGATEPFASSVGQVSLSLGEGVAGWVAANAKPAVIFNKFDDPRYVYLPQLRGEDYQTLISVPLIRSNKDVVGAVNVHWVGSVQAPDEILATLSDVANLFAGLMEAAVLHAQLAKREEEISSFASAIIDAAERERSRVAADVHDGVGQLLLSMMFHLDAALGSLPTEAAEARWEITRAHRLAHDAFDEVRRTISALRPAVIDDFGLPGGLEYLATCYPALEVVVSIEGEISLDPSIESALYRICQEALNNVAKHANSDAVGVRLRQSASEVTLQIADSGDGFDGGDQGSHRSSGFGLQSMRERAELLGGTLKLFSRRGQGTTVMVTIPLRNSPKAPST